MISGRPAGFSSDEDCSDYDDLSLPFDPAPYKANRNYSNIEVDIPDGQKLINAIISKDIEIVKQLLDAAVDVHYKSKKTGTWTPIMHACFVGSKEILELLLISGANPNDHHEMFTPLMCICDSSSKDDDQLLDCLNILLEHGANVNVVDWYRTTPLMLAVKLNHSKLVLKLIELGCSLEQVDSDGWSPIFYAVDSGNIHMVQLLKDAGANLAQEDRRGRTLHEIASTKYLKDIAEIVSVKDKAIDIDERIEHTRVVKCMSHYQFMLTEIPDLNKGRFYGFSFDALKLINGIGLGHLSNIFSEHNVQLAELLTWNDDDWKKVGVEMSFDRQKIKSSVQKFHEHNWSKQSLRIITDNEDVDLFMVSQILCNILRQLHVMSATTYYYLKHREAVKTSKDLNLFTDKGLYHLAFIDRELTLINNLAVKIDEEENIVPADLIDSPKVKSGSYKKVVFQSLMVGFVLYKLRVFSHLTKIVHKLIS